MISDTRYKKVLRAGNCLLAALAVVAILGTLGVLAACGNAQKSQPEPTPETPDPSPYGFPEHAPLPEDFFAITPSDVVADPVDITEEKMIDPDVYMQLDEFYIMENGYDEPAGIFLVLIGAIRNESSEEFIVNTGRSFRLEDLNGQQYSLSYDYSVPPRDDEEVPRMFAGIVEPESERRGELPFDVLEVPPDGVFYLYHESVLTGNVTRWRVH
jgi:hypothetical protein